MGKLKIGPAQVVVVGHGADEAKALLNVRTTLTPRTSGPTPKHARCSASLARIHGRDALA